MRQLSSLDAQFLATEDGRTHGLVGDRDLVPDAWSLITHLEAELAEICRLADCSSNAYTIVPHPKGAPT